MIMGYFNYAKYRLRQAFNDIKIKKKLFDKILIKCYVHLASFHINLYQKCLEAFYSLSTIPLLSILRKSSLPTWPQKNSWTLKMLHKSNIFLILKMCRFMSNPTFSFLTKGLSVLLLQRVLELSRKNKFQLTQIFPNEMTQTDINEDFLSDINEHSLQLENQYHWTMSWHSRNFNFYLLFKEDSQRG